MLSCSWVQAASHTFRSTSYYWKSLSLARSITTGGLTCVVGESLQTAGIRFDMVYFFDVLVHVDNHTQWKYIQQLPSVLKSGGRALLHTANICSDKGFER